MEGVATLFWVVLAGALVIGALAGLVMPKHWRLGAFLAALMAFGLLTAEHVRLNGTPDSGDTAPFIIYAVFAAIALLPAMIGAGLTAWLRNRRA